MNRGAIKKKDSTMVTFWLPKTALQWIDKEIKRTDLDRSKYVRKALMHYLHTFSETDAGSRD